jgi:hypothetical protein
MPKRKTTDIVKVNLRLREALRQRLERQAKRNDTSLNSEMARRLESSLDGEERIADLVGGERSLELFKVIGPAIARIERETGKQWDDDVWTRVRVSRSIAAIMNGFQHRDLDPSNLSVEDALNELTRDPPVGGTLADAAKAGPLYRRVLQGDDNEHAPETDETNADLGKQ